MIQIKEFATRAPKNLSKDQAKDQLKEMKTALVEQVTKMYANKKYSMLIVFQGMDASGKDGVTRRVFSEVSPTMLNAFSFKKPTEEEFAHDFLWRVHKRVPEQGHVHIFNRSHYEDILIQRVHNWINMDMVASRMKAINDFEELLNLHNNTVILKFFMNISPERQLEKLQERKDLLRKNYKHNDGDWEERKHWDSYMDAYEYVLNESKIPWHVVPCDQRWYRDYFVAKTVLKSFEFLNQQYPALAPEE